MSIDLVTEIAWRLGTNPTETGHAYEAVVGFLREQLARDGQARVAGLGTFRLGGENLSFQPDTALAEAVNLKFTGLEPVSVATAPPPRFEPEHTGAPVPERPFAGADFEGDQPEEDTEPSLPEASATSTSAPWPGSEIEEASASSDEPWTGLDEDEVAPEVDLEADAVPETAASDFESEEASDEPAHASWSGDELPEEEAPNFTWADPDATPEPAETESPAQRAAGWAPEGPDAAGDEDWTPSAFESDADEPLDGSETQEAYWEDDQNPDAEHPLGAFPGRSYEEADFSVVDENERGVADHEGEEVLDTSEAADFAGEEVGGADAPELGEADEVRTGAFAWEEESVAEPETDAAPYDTGAEVGSDLPASDMEDTGESDADETLVDEAAVAAALAATPEESPSPGEPGEEVVAPHPHPVQRGPNRFAQEQERPRTPLLVAGIVAVVLLIGIAWWYLLLPDTPAVDEPTAVEQTDPAPVAEVPADSSDAQVAAADAPSAETPAAGAPAVETPAAEAPAVETPDAAAPAPTQAQADEDGPLRGSEPVDPSQGGYTVVVASEATQNAAERVARRFSREGYRTGVVAGEVEGRTHYRVAVGQFRTLRSATAARDRLQGGAFPRDAWVLALR